MHCIELNITMKPSNDTQIAIQACWSRCAKPHATDTEDSWRWVGSDAVCTTCRLGVHETPGHALNHKARQQPRIQCLLTNWKKFNLQQKSRVSKGPASRVCTLVNSNPCSQTSGWEGALILLEMQAAGCVWSSQLQNALATEVDRWHWELSEHWENWETHW